MFKLGIARDFSTSLAKCQRQLESKAPRLRSIDIAKFS